MKFYTSSMLISFIFIGLTYGEEVQSKPKIQAQLSPIPPYPPDGSIPISLEGQYVFRDLATGDLVLSYPAELSSSALPLSSDSIIDGHGRITQRVSLRNNIDPWFDVGVTREGNKVVYSYILRNGSKASKAIAEWHIDFPNTVPRTSRGVAENPADLFSATDQIDVTSPIKWASSSDGDVIRPGLSSAKLMVPSSLKPGFDIASVSGSAVPMLDRLQVPPAVRVQIDRLKISIWTIN